MSTRFCIFLLALMLAVFPLQLKAADAEGPPDPKEVQAVLDKAIAYLKKRQNEDGSFAPKIAGPGVSALVVAALLRNGVEANDPLVAKTLEYMQKKVQKDGGVYDKGLANYTTSVALMAFSEANADKRYDALIANASKFLKGLQFDENKTDNKDPKFGGVGYDATKRPDHVGPRAVRAAGIATMI